MLEKERVIIDGDFHKKTYVHRDDGIKRSTSE